MDGGSEDDTVALAERQGARVLRVEPPQRARQMNAGGRAARGDVLVFLHADTVFQPGAIDALRQLASESPLVGGGFRRRYASPSLVLAASCRLGNLRASQLGWFFGDQAIWASREAFERVGGFPEVARFEDLDFTRRLRRLGPTALVVPGVVTSARRFGSRVLPRVLADSLLTVRHVCMRTSC